MQQREKEHTEDPRMTRYFHSIESLVVAYKTLEDLDPSNQLLGFIKPNGNVPIKNRPVSSFKFLPGFHEKYPLKDKNEYDYDAKIEQHGKYENDLRAEIVLRETIMPASRT